MAKTIMDNKRELEIRVNKFLNRISERFPQMKITKNLACFYKMDFASFLKEIRKSNKGNIKLSLKETDEWEDYFKVHKAQVMESLNIIFELGAKLDSKVFDLYVLSETQRRVVLKSFSSD
jgi:PHP family Zn ribbon phosphoesterase